MKKILIIHLARFGDIVQTLSVVDIIHTAEPETIIHFLTSETFAFFPEHHPAISKTFRFVEGIHADLLKNDNTFEQLSEKAKECISELRNEKYDEIINYQHGIGGPLIIKLVDAGVKKGSGVTQTGSQTILYDGWTKLLFLTSKSRKRSSINIGAFYARIAGYTPTILPGQLTLSDRERQTVDDFLASIKKPYICLQVNASKEYRTWPHEHFQKFLELLSSQFEGTIVLVGTREESYYTQSLVQDATNIINLCGKTDFLLLTGVLSHAQMLVTNDTGTMHLAAYRGTTVVALGFSEVSARETAPYARAQVFYLQPCLECYPCIRPNTCKIAYRCRYEIKPRDVISVIYTILHNKAIDTMPSEISCDLFYMENNKYKSLVKRTIERERIEEETFRLSLPYIWEMYGVRGQKERSEETTQQAVLEIATRLFDQYDISYDEIMRSYQKFMVRKDAFVNLIQRGLSLVSTYLRAIQTQEDTIRKRIVEEMAAFDEEMRAASGIFSFFGDWYDLEYRLSSIGTRDIVRVLEENNQYIITIGQAMQYFDFLFYSVALERNKKEE